MTRSHRHLTLALLALVFLASAGTSGALGSEEQPVAQQSQATGQVQSGSLQCDSCESGSPDFLNEANVSDSTRKEMRDCQHKWVTKTKRKWVPPVYKKVVVGKDKNGTPIHKNVLVKAGYWKTSYVTSCRKCGKVR